MDQRKIGILHPGQMGISIAAAAKQSGNAVYWASAGSSDQTRQRADEHGLQDGQVLKAASFVDGGIIGGPAWEPGVPGGFHAAAAEIYDRLASFKNAPETPSLDSVLAALAQTTQSEPY